MAEAVVDGLEVVDVEEQQRHGPAAGPGVLQGLLEPAGEQGPVGQAGEGVAEGERPQLVLHPAALGDVADEGVEAAGAGRRRLPQHHLDREAGAVGAQRGGLDPAAGQVRRPGQRQPLQRRGVGVAAARPGR